jgi:hypothetical protein
MIPASAHVTNAASLLWQMGSLKTRRGSHARNKQTHNNWCQEWKQANAHTHIEVSVESVFFRLTRNHPLAWELKFRARILRHWACDIPLHGDWAPWLWFGKRYCCRPIWSYVCFACSSWFEYCYMFKLCFADRHQSTIDNRQSRAKWTMHTYVLHVASHLR